MCPLASPCGIPATTAVLHRIPRQPEINKTSLLLSVVKAGRGQQRTSSLTTIPIRGISAFFLKSFTISGRPVVVDVNNGFSCQHILAPSSFSGVNNGRNLVQSSRYRATRDVPLLPPPFPYGFNKSLGRVIYK